MYRLIFCSPVDLPNSKSLNGQSIVTSYVISHQLFGEKVSVIEISWISIHKLIRLYYLVVLKFLNYSNHCSTSEKVEIYLVISRSWYGFFRDLPILALAKFFPFIKLYCHCHGSDLRNLFNKYYLLSRFAVFIYENAFILMPSKYIAKEINHKFKLKVIPIDNPLIKQQASITKNLKGDDQLQTSREMIKILWNSNVIYSKGIFQLIETIAMLNQNSTIKLTILGLPLRDSFYTRKETSKKLKTYIRKFEWIEYLGKVDNRERYYDLLHESHIVALPSFYKSECQPLTIIEAMCAAKSIIISDLPQMLETVGSYPCEVVSLPINTKELSITIQNLISLSKSTEYKARLRRQSLLASERYSTKQFENNFIELTK